MKRARHTLLFDPKLESSRGRTTPIMKEYLHLNSSKLAHRLEGDSAQVCGLDMGLRFDLPNPPRTWTDNYLKSEGRGLIGFAKKPDFQLKDVLPHWTNDGWFWWKVQKPHTVYSSGNVQMWK